MCHSATAGASRAMCPRIIRRALRGGVDHLVEVGARGRVDRWQARRQLLELPCLLWCGKPHRRSLFRRWRRLRRRRRKLSGVRGSGCSRYAECRPRAEQRSPPCARRLVARRWRFQQKQQRRQPGEAHEIAEAGDLGRRIHQHHTLCTILCTGTRSPLSSLYTIFVQESTIFVQVVHPTPVCPRQQRARRALSCSGGANSEFYAQMKKRQAASRRRFY